jgi:pyruvate kinase
MKLESRQVPIVAKIEKPQAIDNLEEIVAAADGVMVARGDLGVEVSLEMIPAFQKRIIRCANQAGKLVITATQMLETMTESSIPTRAEVTDVANAILDGTDVVMLSGETAVGKYPVEAVRRMSAIARTTEETLYPYARAVSSISLAGAVQEGIFTPVIARLAGHASRDVDPRAIVVFTRSGRTARILSYERPRAPVLAFTTEETTLRRLALSWGVIPRKIAEVGSAEELAAIGERFVLEGGWARRDEPVLFLVGTSTTPGATNSIKIARIGDVEREAERLKK